MKLTTLVVLVGLLSVSAFAADINGTWTGEGKSGEGNAISMSATLKADGGKLTGTVTNRLGTDQKIENGTVNGDAVKFDVTFTREGQSRVIHFTGKVEGGKLQLHQQLEGAQKGQDWTLSKK